MAPYNPNRNDPFLDVRRLRVRPGDVVIVRFPERVPDSYVQSALEIMKKRLVQAGHPTTPVLIAQGGATVEVLGHEERETVQGTDGPVEVFRLDAAPEDEQPGPDNAPTRRAAGELIAERMRQITGENYARSHDDSYKPGELAAAGAAYAFSAATAERYYAADPAGFWPWDRSSFKPTDPRRDLVKAGALILAEIERIDRAAYVATLEAEATP